VAYEHIFTGLQETNGETLRKDEDHTIDANKAGADIRLPNRADPFALFGRTGLRGPCSGLWRNS